MQYWPRKRAKRIYARVRSHFKSNDCKPFLFAGYKAGMTHLIVTDNRASSTTTGEEIFVPVTAIECPSLKIAGIRFYKKTPNGLSPSSQISFKVDKELERKIVLPKKTKEINFDEAEKSMGQYADIRLIVYTQPKLTGLEKKKPELFEMKLGGTISDRLKWAKENQGKEITIESVFKDGDQIDVHSITKGKGYQGPVKRFGIGLRSHKSEKTIRGPGSLGGWRGQGHVMWRVAHAGQTGYHQRTEYNKHIVKIGKQANEINPKGGFLRYGLIKNSYILVKGSVPGPTKRMIMFTKPIRPNKKIPDSPPEIHYTSLKSKQGN